MALSLTREEARRGWLTQQGLLGAPRFVGKQGALEYVRQAGCIQYDPIDVCGKNAEIVLQARVKGFTRAMLEELLYRDRLLVDYWDKNMAIFLAEDWPCFARTRAHFCAEGRNQEAVSTAFARVYEALEGQVCVSAQQLQLPQKVDWSWAPTSLARAALETLYFEGKLVVHHKQGTQKYYARACDCLPRALLDAPDPFPDEAAYQAFLALRRMGGVGMLWNRPSDAWLGIRDFKAAQREAAFQRLLQEGAILPLEVEGVRGPLYIRAQDAAYFTHPAEGRPYRTEILAPLDGFMWDRNLIAALFDFDYKWEIYTPVAQRKYGYYVRPILQGDRLVGRVEVAQQGEDLAVRQVWWQPNVSVTGRRKAGLAQALSRLAKLNGLRHVLGWE